MISRSSVDRPVKSVEGATNSAGFGPAPLAPGAVMSLFGQGFGVLSVAESTPLPFNLAGTSVWFDRYRGALFFVSPQQINVQIPWDLGAARSTLVTVIRDGIAGAPIVLPIEPYRPGVFTISGVGPVVINKRTGRLVTAEEPARAGDALIIFTTGGGPVTAQPETAGPSPPGPLATGLFDLEAVIAANGIEVLVQPFFAGLAPGFIGVYQINLIVPTGLEGGEATLQVQSLPFAASNAVTLFLE